MMLAALERTQTSRIITNLAREEYDRWQEPVNWSRLKMMAKSPAHYAWALEHPSADTAARKRGRASHTATLEPSEFLEQFAVWRGGRRAGREWDAFVAEHPDQEILTVAEYDQAMGIADAVRAHDGARRYLREGDPEVTVLWSSEIVPGMPVPCKGRLDWLGPDCIVDLKTTRDASPEGFAREAWRYQYPGQLAMYQDGVFAATGRRLPVIIIAVESEAPHVVQVFRVPDSVLAVGRAEYERCLATLVLCRAEGRWSGYADSEVDLVLPRWVRDAEAIEVES